MALPPARCGMKIKEGVVELGGLVEDKSNLREILMAFHPWRKGPFEAGGVAIDTEWHSDWKWERVRKHLGSGINLRGARVLDIGCGNGYFGWRMLDEGAEDVVGIDPILVFVMQWLACRHFAGELHNYVLPLGIEDLAAGTPAFDAVFSMGVLYHRRDPLEHLQQIRKLLKPGGTLVLETLVWPDTAIGAEWKPPARYGRMRNVWSVPRVALIQQWLDDAGYAHARLLDINQTRTDEQRSTEWMRFESLAEALDSENPGLTVEGFPAPTRALLLAVS
jgi:tRNA (mo5U34)-methyltransferase